MIRLLSILWSCSNNTIDGAAFAVLLDSEGNIIQKREFFASMDDDMLETALDKIESSGMSSGIIKIGTDDLAFSKKSTFRGTAIAFTSRAWASECAEKKRASARDAPASAVVRSSLS